MGQLLGPVLRICTYMSCIVYIRGGDLAAKLCMYTLWINGRKTKSIIETNSKANLQKNPNLVISNPRELSRQQLEEGGTCNKMRVSLRHMLK